MFWIWTCIWSFYRSSSWSQDSKIDGCPKKKKTLYFLAKTFKCLEQLIISWKKIKEETKENSSLRIEYFRFGQTFQYQLRKQICPPFFLSFQKKWQSYKGQMSYFCDVRRIDFVRRKERKPLKKCVPSCLLVIAAMALEVV